MASLFRCGGVPLPSYQHASAHHGVPTPLFTGAEAYHFLLLCQRQLYAGYPADAMKTAMRLREYEQVLPPAEIYALIALTAFYSKYYAQCSKAFVRLQSMSNLPPHKKEAIDKLALSIFSKIAERGGITAQGTVDCLAYLFAQFHTELVEGIEVPEDAFHRRAVFVESEERTEGLGFHAAHADRVARPVARQHEVWRQTLDVGRRRAACRELLPCLDDRSSLHQRLRLRDGVCHQPGVLGTA